MNATDSLRTFRRRMDALVEPLRRVWRVGLVVAVGLATIELAPSATAQSASGSVAVDIPISSAPMPTRSITVSPNAATYICANPDGLSFPNGRCNTERITIRNGAVPSRILVNGADAVPEGGGTNWVLCGGAVTGDPTCVNAGQPQPGADQYRESTVPFFPFSQGPILSNTPKCDTAFTAFTFGGSGGSCDAGPNQSSGETVALTGPASSTTMPDSFSTAIMWTASP